MSQDDNATQHGDAGEALSHYVGTWDVVAGPADAPFATGVNTAEWVLGGQFVRGGGALKTADGSNDFEIIGLRTFDPQAGVYRLWSFFSTGMVVQTEGTWDPAERTMTDVTRYGDITQTTRSRFTEDGVEEWTQVNTNATGEVVSEMQGRNTRRTGS